MTFTWPRKKRNKYGNVPCYALGMKFRSKRERDYAIYLEGQKQDGNILSWEYEKSFDLFSCPREAIRGPIVVCKTKPDFYVITKYFKEQVHEIKQPFTKTSLWKLKYKIFQINYPDIEYKVILK